MYDSVKDSGQRHDFGTGSVRDIQEGKGRFDLLPVFSLFRLAKHFENGSKKYGSRNWEQGQNLSCYINSALRHTLKYLLGLRDEDHAAAAIWNMSCLIDTDIKIRLGLLPQKLNDLPKEIPPEKAEEILKILEGLIPELAVKEEEKKDN